MLASSASSASSASCAAGNNYSHYYRYHLISSTPIRIGKKRGAWFLVVSSALLSLTAIGLLAVAQIRASLTTDLSATVAAAAASSSWSHVDNHHHDHDHANKTKKEKVFAHFLSHIPKTGGNYVLLKINSLLRGSPEWLALPRGDRFRACQQGSLSPARFDGQYRSAYRGTACTMWMAEHGYAARPRRAYTVVRPPVSHCASMYFHCVESADHARWRHKMPASLDEWLTAWVDAVVDTNNTTSTITNRTMQQRVQLLQRRFRCYNPINPQAAYLLRDDDDDKDDDGYDENAASAALPSSSSSSFEIGDGNWNETVKATLRRRYTVIGDQAQMAKSVCLITIRYAGWVPRECNCSNTAANGAVDGNGQGRQEPPRRATDTVRHVAHGVRHHGDTYNLTATHLAAIAKLRRVDAVLYHLARDVFGEQVAAVQAEYDVQICDEFGDSA